MIPVNVLRLTSWQFFYRLVLRKFLIVAELSPREEHVWFLRFCCFPAVYRMCARTEDFIC